MATKKIYIGDVCPRGWIHIDKLDSSKLKYKNCCVEEVYADRVLEFLSPEDTVKYINEWKRVLRVGGKFTIVFADFVKSAFLYQRNVITIESFQEALIGEYQTALCKERVENLLVMRYEKVYEGFKSLKKRPIWTSILIAEKMKNGED